jgi:GH15 family glucan-1,4-alpha-glucosidase
MGISGKELTRLNDDISRHMDIIMRCTSVSEKYGRLLLASPPESRYPYVYTRDSSCAVQLLRRLAGSAHGYDAAETAYGIMKSMARFMKDTISPEGSWGQRYSIEGENKSIYRQEDNVAHGISIICNYLLTAEYLKRDIEDLESFLACVDRALGYGRRALYEEELNLFYSTTAIHESAMEQGYTCWVNFSFLYAFSLAKEVADKIDEKNIISSEHLSFRERFLYSVSELFMSGNRYVRRTDPSGAMDMRPDFTLLSPFYYGFLHYKEQMENSVTFIEKQLWDNELGMIMRYLPYYRDFSTHVHAGNGPWLQYSAVLAQYHYWSGNVKRGDELLAIIDSYRSDAGEIPEHLSTPRRFEEFMEREWKTGIDFQKEFYKDILLDNIEFNKILEEANNMHRSYEACSKRRMFRKDKKPGEGYIQFASPLMWSHAEYARALLVRAGDWWKVHREE